MISIQGVSYRYGDKRALDNVNLSIPSGEIFALLGPNGGGKSTLIRILSTLQKMQSGTIQMAGKDVNRDPISVRKTLGNVFQHPSLDKKLTVYENLYHQGRLYLLGKAFLKTRIIALLEEFSLQDRAHDRVESLSGGLARRVEIAKAMIHDPKILLMDEPSTGLDPSIRYDLWNLLVKLRDRLGTTILLTTHLMEEAEKCDHVAIIDLGRIVAQGTPQELKMEAKGDVLELKTNNSAQLAAEIEKKFSVKVKTSNGTVRIESGSNPTFLKEVIEDFSNEILEASFRKPSLEDIFMLKTGKRFD